ncbi:hypothetical protein EVAR_31876_1 [Eumeta japonica]|uniref:Uncharacterized protein n=1 Tax=Eumeta variegata TaxID=151549 RepID=A0A4C1WUZ5_EUMVA|nr:hypothetical protein EVAR_31876_1 [Eumeta japonica]
MRGDRRIRRAFARVPSVDIGTERARGRDLRPARHPDCPRRAGPLEAHASTHTTSGRIKFYTIYIMDMSFQSGALNKECDYITAGTVEQRIPRL